MKISACPACGAPVHPVAEQCAYCGQYMLSESGKPVDQETARAGVLFHRKSEPNENAFSLMVPKGWMLEGGIYRSNMMTQVVDAQSIEAKLDLTIKSDPAGQVMMRLCPDWSHSHRHILAFPILQIPMITVAVTILATVST